MKERKRVPTGEGTINMSRYVHQWVQVFSTSSHTEALKKAKEYDKVGIPCHLRQKNHRWVVEKGIQDS